MQLRKTCNHPYLFDGVELEGQDEYGEHIVSNCKKMEFVDKLLKKTRKAGEQVLIFSQFVTMLDIIEDFCVLRKYKFCRLDGSTPLEDRESQINSFTN